MKRFVLIMLMMLFAFGFVSCDFFSQGEETTLETTENITTTTSETTEEVTTWSSLEIQLLNIYNLAIEADAFDGTYEEWLESVRGPQGDNGEAVELTLEGNFIKWKYESEVVWNDLIPLDDLMGNPGVSITETTLNESGELIITYSDDTTQNLGRIITRFQVTFYDYNGYFLDSEFVTYDGNVIPPDNPERDGHTFTGWSEILTNIVSDMDVFAIYEVNTYTVSFESNEGTNYQDMVVSFGDTIFLPTPVREGYIFSGWFKGETINDAQFTSDTEVKCDITLYAKWIQEVNLEDINVPVENLGTEIIDDFGGIPEFAGMVYIEAVEPDPDNDITGNNASVDVAYKICEIKNDVLQQLSPWVSTDASEITISTEKITSSTITAGISTSISTTIGATVGIPEVASASLEVSLGITASLEVAVTQAQSSSLSIKFPLDGLDPTEDYAVFLTGSYEVYQVFSTDYLTGTVTDYIFVRILDASVIRLLSSSDANVNGYIDLTEYKIQDFSLDNFKVQLNGDGSINSPYEIYTETDLYAMMFEPDASFKLMNNITIDKFKGINGVAFTGFFDGQGYSIDKFSLSIEPKVLNNDAYFGFFGIIDGGTVKDIKFTNPNFNYRYVEDVTHAGSGYLYYGTLCGLARNGALIDNVDVEYAVISNARLNAYIGGVVGYINGNVENPDTTQDNLENPCYIYHCDIQYSKLSGCGYLGGVAGKINNTTMYKCNLIGNQDNNSEISFYSTGEKRRQGGIVGWVVDSKLINLSVVYTKLVFNGTFTVNPVVGVIAGGVFTSEYQNLVDSNVTKTEGNITDKWYNIQHKDYYYKYNNAKFGFCDNVASFDLIDSVEFLDWDGTTLQSDDYLEGEDISFVTAPTDPVREGYTFTGWSVEVPDIMPGTDVTVTANYTINQYTITFDTSGNSIMIGDGSYVAPITQDYGTEVSPPENPTNTSNALMLITFGGWYLDEACTIPYTFDTMPAENITLYANWYIDIGPVL